MLRLSKMNKLSNVLFASSRIFHHRESTPNVFPSEMNSISSNNDHKIGLYLLPIQNIELNIYR